jgi:hypothetical protein
VRGAVAGHNGGVPLDWSRYWHSADRPLEAMHAHFERHVYHRHSHESYSFGVTESGAQSFTCRGAAHTSATGMVMAFNPDDPHDGHAGDELGFTYRMVHIGPDLVADVLADRAGRRTGLPLFAAPVIEDPLIAANLRALHASSAGPRPCAATSCSPPPSPRSAAARRGRPVRRATPPGWPTWRAG